MKWKSFLGAPKDNGRELVLARPVTRTATMRTGVIKGRQCSSCLAYVGHCGRKGKKKTLSGSVASLMRNTLTRAEWGDRGFHVCAL